MAESNVPVLGAVRAAFGFWKFSTPRIAGVLTAVLLVNLVSAVVGGIGVQILIGVVGAAMGLMASGALLRLAFADEHAGDPDFRIGPAGFQWGRPETRLLAGALLLIFLFVLGLLFLLVAAFVCSAVAVLAGAKVDPTAVALDPNTLPAGLRLTVGLLADVFALVGIWIGVRISLYPSATVAEKRLMVFSTWKLTRGQFWRILAAIVIVLLPALVLTLVIMSLELPAAVALPARLLLILVNAFFEAPLLCGLYAYLYRGLRPTVSLPSGPMQTAVSVGPWS